MAYGGYGDGNMNLGASQFGGGGFMASPAPGHENQYGGGQQKGRNQHNSLRAFTIRHLLKEIATADDEHYVADGHDISTVTIIGKVTSYQEGPTRVLLQVYDGTGSIEVCSWVDDMDLQAQKRIEWQIGKYVRVYGNLKTFERKRSITAFAVKPITDHNEATYHFLQCIMQYLHLTKGAPPTGQSGGGATPAVGARTAGGQAGGAGFGLAQGGYGDGAPVAAGPADDLAAMMGGPDERGKRGGDIGMDLKHLYNQPAAMQAPSGLGVEQALNELRKMGRNYTLQQVIQACEVLAADGVLYSTINDMTYKSCA